MEIRLIGLKSSTRDDRNDFMLTFLDGRYRSWRLIGLAAGIVLAAAMSRSDAAEGTASQAPAKVNYAAFVGTSGLGVRFGAEKGFFKDEGLDVTFVTLDDTVSGLVSGDVDIGDVATTSAIIAAGKGAPIKIVSSLFRTKGPFYLIAKPEIGSIAELKGKTIGVAAFGSGLDVYTRVILQKNGIDLKDVTLIANGVNAQAFASLTSGQVAATIIHEPFVSLGEKLGNAKLLARGWDYLPTFHTGVIAARTDFIAKHPDAVAKLIRAYFKSETYAKSHLDEYSAFFRQNVKVDPDVLQKAQQREDVLWENDPNVDLSSLNDTQQIQLQLGFQDRIYDINKLVDLRFVPKN